MVARALKAPRLASDPGAESLRWEDIDWEMNRMSIPEPKVEHHEALGIRSCPIFPELRPILDEAFEIFGDKSEYVVAAPQYRAAAKGRPIAKPLVDLGPWPK